jgi:hypothetical protein
MKLQLSALFFIISGASFAQDIIKTKKWDEIYISAKAQNLLVNRKFGSIVTGQPSETTIGNFASLDPVAGSFSLKGSTPLRRDSTSNAFSYLTFSFAGDLISDSYAALFSNTSLNTNTVFDMQYHFRLRNSFKKIRFLSKDLAALTLKKKMLLLDSVDIERRLGDTTSIRKNKELNSLKLAVTINNINEKRAVLDSFALATEKLRNIGPLYKDMISKNVDTMFMIQKTIGDLVEDSVKSIKTIDSLDFSYINFHDLSNFFRVKFVSEYRDSLKKLENASEITGLKFGWFTISVGGSKKNYYTYNSLLPFSQQITKNDLSALRIGLTYNFYVQRSFPNRTSLFSLGFLRYKDNNTSLLSTQAIKEETVIKNSIGDVTRKITQRYQTYTDPIIEDTVWSFFANVYLISGAKTNAVHIFPSWDFYHNKNNILNAGLGYVVSFKNLKKDQPVFNAEAYIQLKDVFDHLQQGKNFWNLNEFGIRLTLPFFIF